MRAYATGDRISHAQYGTGTIAAVNEHHTVIEFDEHGRRTFSTPLVKLERSNTVAPVRPRATGRRKTAPRTPAS